MLIVSPLVELGVRSQGHEALGVVLVRVANVVRVRVVLTVQVLVEFVESRLAGCSMGASEWEWLRKGRSRLADHLLSSHGVSQQIGVLVDLRTVVPDDDLAVVALVVRARILIVVLLLLLVVARSSILNVLARGRPAPLPANDVNHHGDYQDQHRQSHPEDQDQGQLLTVRKGRTLCRRLVCRETTRRLARFDYWQTCRGCGGGCATDGALALPI